MKEYGRYIIIHSDEPQFKPTISKISDHVILDDTWVTRTKYCNYWRVNDIKLDLKKQPLTIFYVYLYDFTNVYKKNLHVGNILNNIRFVYRGFKTFSHSG